MLAVMSPGRSSWGGWSTNAVYRFPVRAGLRGSPISVSSVDTSAQLVIGPPYQLRSRRSGTRESAWHRHLAGAMGSAVHHG